MTTAPTHPWPATKRDDVSDVLFGKTIRDPYRWLEDEKAPAVAQWMEAQDAYARAELAKSPARAELAERLRQVFYFDATSAPHRLGDHLFYARKHVDKEKSVVYWKRGAAGSETVLFDPNTWSDDGSAGLGTWVPSYDGKHVAYALKLHNSDESTLHVRDVTTGKDLADAIPGTKYAGPSWTPDGKGFYYTWVPEVGAKVTLPSGEVREVTVADRPGFADLRFHALGTDPTKDPIVHAPTYNPETFLGGGVSRDGHWLFAVVQHGWNASDVYFRDARKAGDWQPLVVGVPAIFTVEAWHDKFFIHTNDGAPRYRLYVADPKHPARTAWKEIVPEADATLDHVRVIGDHLVLAYLRHASSVLELRTLDGKLRRAIAVPPLGAVDSITGEPDDPTFYLSYTSFTEPHVVYKAEVERESLTEWSRVKLPIDTAELVAEQVFYPSKDGTKISMFILHRKDTPRDGSAPTILYGYGGFNVSLTPGFASSRAVWLERGGIYAIPNLRGGGEYGEDWHKAGMLLAKQNVFDDFIAAGEYLIAQKWTSSAHLAISGGSNGGLLVGAVAMQRPDLMKAVVCSVPLLDMLRYHLFGSGKTWVPEYGSADDAAQFAALYAYSPYRIAVDAGPRNYPAILFDSADHDDRVDPLHARKLAAVVQHGQRAELPILLRIERNSGHGGADMVKSQVDRYADQLAWLLRLLT